MPAKGQFLLDPALVPDIRRRYREDRFTNTADRLAAEFGVTRRYMVRLLNGSTFGSEGASNVPPAPTKKRTFTAEEVVAMRESYPRKGVTLRSLASRFSRGKGRRVHENTIRMILLGQAYADVPGALTSLKSSNENHIGRVRKVTQKQRRFPPEVVLFMRLQYDPDKCSTLKLARYYKVPPSRMCILVSGKSYREVPMVAKPMSASGSKPKMTDAQVFDARVRFHAGEISSRQVAVELGVTQAAAYNMLMFKTYRHVGPVIPMHESKRKRLTIKYYISRSRTGWLKKPLKPGDKRVRETIKFPRQRLPDHHEAPDACRPEMSMEIAA